MHVDIEKDIDRVIDIDIDDKYLQVVIHISLDGQD